MKKIMVRFFKSYIHKPVLILLLSGLFSQAVSAQEKNHHRGERGGEARHDGLHQNNHPVNIERNHTNIERPLTRPENITRINRTNTTNRTNTINRTNITNRSVNNNVTVNRTVNNYRRPVYNASNPNWRYAYLPRRNSVVTVFPTGFQTITFGGFGYRYYHGSFYRPYNSAFIVVAPPVGIFINVLPFGYRRIYVHDYPYYYYNGAYYDYRDKHYTVVSAPVGAVVESLPDGFQTVTIEGETYYMADGAQYKPIVQDNGEIGYQVIKAN